MKTRLLIALGSAAILAAITAVPHAQAPQPAGVVEFDAATVKKSAPDEQGSRIGFAPGGRFNTANVPLRNIISAAYGTPQPLPPFLVIGGPDWIDKEHFDIVAKAAGDPQPGPNGPPPVMFQMIQTLLAERFKLVVHREKRDQPVYALVKARADGKLGDAMHVSTFDCSTLMAAARTGTPPPGPNAPFCGLRVGPGKVTAGSAGMAMFANSLARGVNRFVVDQTGLTGTYDFELNFAPDQMPQDRGGAGALSPTSDGASIFTALQEQLGLKLQSTTAPVDVLVIDAVERPADN